MCRQLIFHRGKKKVKENSKIPLLKPPNSQGLLENQADPTAFQQEPTACKRKIITRMNTGKRIKY